MALLRQIALPAIAMLVAAGLEFGMPQRPVPALFLAWPLLAYAACSIMLNVPNALRNEAGRVDASELVTCAWFVMLSSALGAASLWNIFSWKAGAGMLTAFVDIPGQLWVMAGLPLVGNVGVRLAFAMYRSRARSGVSTAPTMQQLLSSPVDPEPNPKMGVAQYLMLNMIVFLVYAIAIGRLFAAITPGATIATFPGIPDEILALVGISVGGFVTTVAIAPTVMAVVAAK